MIICAIAAIADENEWVNINHKNKETIIDIGRINLSPKSNTGNYHNIKNYL